MVKPVQRFDDSNDAAGIIKETDGNSTVFANGKLVSVDTSTVRYFPGTTSTANGSGSVFAHGVPINYTDNNDQDGNVRVGGSSDVFVGDEVDQDTPSIRATVDGDEEDAEALPGQPSSTYFQEKVAAGVISPSEVERESNVQPTGQTSGPAQSNVSPETTDPGDVGEDFPDSLVLSSRFTLGKLTKKPGVVFQHSVTTPNALGLPTKTIVENLKLLAINTLEPIFTKFPNVVLTNTFRPDSKSQHGRGQAADLQFRNVSKSEYFNIALWIRDNVPFDQLLLEYKTTGTGLPWIHISFAVPQRPVTNLTKVMTFLNDRRETKTAANGYGLIQLAEA